MLNELTGLLRNSQINDYKKNLYASRQYNLQQKRISPINTFITEQEPRDWTKDYHEKEIADVKKILQKNQTKGEDFKSILLKACEKLKK